MLNEPKDTVSVSCPGGDITAYFDSTPCWDYVSCDRHMSQHAWCYKLMCCTGIFYNTPRNGKTVLYSVLIYYIHTVEDIVYIVLVRIHGATITPSYIPVPVLSILN